MQETIDVSVVIPVYNEEESLPELHERLVNALELLGRPWEIIYVDDGSSDSTLSLLEHYREKDVRVKVVKFTRNFGQQPAMMAGFKYSMGKVVITLDADLQNPPEDIPKFIAEMEKGNDAVYGWRVDRKDSLIARKIPSYLGNLLVSRYSGVRLHDYQCNFRAFSRKVIDYILETVEPGQLPSLLGARGAKKVLEIEVGHARRRYGDSKYTFKTLLSLAMDIITGYSTRPFQYVGFLGLLLFVSGSVLSVSYVAMRVASGEQYLRLLLFTLIILFMGLQFTILGFLGEYIMRIYSVTQKKPMYKVEKFLG